MPRQSFHAECWPQYSYHWPCWLKPVISGHHWPFPRTHQSFYLALPSFFSVAVLPWLRGTIQASLPDEILMLLGSNACFAVICRPVPRENWSLSSELEITWFSIRLRRFDCHQYPNEIRLSSIAFLMGSGLDQESVLSTCCLKVHVCSAGGSSFGLVTELPTHSDRSWFTLPLTTRIHSTW